MLVVPLRWFQVEWVKSRQTVRVHIRTFSLTYAVCFQFENLEADSQIFELNKKRPDLGNVCGPSKFPAPLVNVFGVFQIVKSIVNDFIFEKKTN